MAHSKSPLPHDAFFKSTMSDKQTAKDFFCAHLPAELLEKLDLTNMVLCQETYIDAKLAKSLTDVVYQTTYAKQDAYIYILAEHFSSPKASSLLQIMRYALSVAEEHMKKYTVSVAPVVIPMIIYNGKTPWALPRNWLDVFQNGRALMNKLYNEAFPLVDLSQISDEQMRDHASAALMEWCLKHANEKHLRQNVQQLVNFFRQSCVLADQTRLLQTMHYILYNIDYEESFILDLVAHFPAEVRETMTSIAQRIERRCIKQGIEQGIEQGREQGGEIGIAQTLQAIELLQKGGDIAEVSQATGIDFVHLTALVAKLQH